MLQKSLIKPSSYLRVIYDRPKAKIKGSSIQHLCSVPLPAGFSRGYSCVLFPDMCFFILFFFFFLLLQHARLGIEPAPPAVEARSLNHWTTREVPCFSILNVNSSIHSFVFFSLRNSTCFYCLCFCYLEANIYLNIHSTKVSKIESSLLNRCFAFSVKCNIA